MMAFLYITLGLLESGLAFCLLMYARNEWLHRKIQIVLDVEDFDFYYDLPSYNYMMWHFWIWDMKKFYQNDKENNK
jgi:hypothetical protein